MKYQLLAGNDKSGAAYLLLAREGVFTGESLAVEPLEPGAEKLKPGEELSLSIGPIFEVGELVRFNSMEDMYRVKMAINGKELPDAFLPQMPAMKIMQAMMPMDGDFEIRLSDLDMAYMYFMAYVEFNRALAGFPVDETVPQIKTQADYVAAQKAKVPTA